MNRNISGDPARRRYLAGLAILIAVFIAVNGYYFHRSQTPTFWDDSAYLSGSLELFDSLTQNGVRGFVNTFGHLHPYLAPLICALPTPLYLALGRDHDPRFLIGAGLIILLSLYLFWMGECLWSAREGLLAVAIVQTMPLIYGLSRQFIQDYGLTTLVVMWMYYLLCRPLNSAGTVVRMGIVLGLGMLMKITFPLYVGVPTALIAIAALRERRDWRGALTVVRNFLFILLAGGIIASIWYLPNRRSIYSYALSTGFGKLAENYGSTNVFSPAVLFQYFVVLAICAFSCYYVLLAIGLLPWGVRALFRKVGMKTLHKFGLICWLIVPLAVTSFGVNKDPRYVAPILPAMALLLAYFIAFIFGRTRWFAAFAGALMIVPTIAYASASLPAFERLGDFTIGRWVIWSPHLAWYASIPSSEGAWDQAKIVEMVCRDAQTAPDASRMLITLAHQYLNNANMGYIASRLKCKAQIIGIPQDLKPGPQLTEWLDGAKPAYVLAIPVVPQPELAPPFANDGKNEVERIVSQPGSGFRLFYRGSLGFTGKEYLIYRRI
ncbi:MAG TPA: glycosyltransferase family 39 protein [Bryobacteraceae bacterium]